MLRKGKTAVRRLAAACDIVRSLPPGHGAAVRGPLKKRGLDRLIAPPPSPARAQVLARLTARLLEPASQRAPARGRAGATAVSPLGEILDAERDEAALSGALSWLLARQERRTTTRPRVVVSHLAPGASGEERAGPGKAAPRRRLPGAL